MVDDLKRIIPVARLRNRYIDRVSFASDAGFYYLLPRAIVQPLNEEEIINLFRFSHQHKIPLVFRTGGTSLSGQSITDGILVDLSQFWTKIKVEAEGTLVRVQPGITGAQVNAHLKRYNRKIGPDPSSISAAMMGGILSNNASGMCCGVAQNSYHTTRYIRFILPSGQAFTTEKKGDYERFETDCSDLFNRLSAIRQQIIGSPELAARIRQKYRTKTTIGYSLNAFIDYEHPLDILAHLLIGAEGTLAFIAEAVLETVPDYPYKATALLYFPTIYAACQAIAPLTQSSALMVELMDRASLHAVEHMAGMPALIKTLPESAAALLVEFQEASSELLAERVSLFLGSSSELSLLETPQFTTDQTEREFFWKVRKGLFPAVGAVRASGTTVILEDIAFPVDQLGAAIIDLQVLFKSYEYANAIIFGHAKDGNIHFVITQSFNSTTDVDRYAAFMRDVVNLVVGQYRGTLKAEHGTGRNMAPFVETEWGEEAYQIICQLKRLIDPEGLLNPGVIVNSNPKAHIQLLKSLPAVEEEVDRCIECGYCEHKCPSRDLTTTPRRRIVIRRALKNLELAGETANHKLLLNEFQYDGVETCAVDGLCATACPVDINTGDLIKRLRRENHSPAANQLADWVARHFSLVEGAARTGIKIGFALNYLFGNQTMFRLTKTVRKIVPAFPLWNKQITYPPDLSVLHTVGQSAVAIEKNTIVYFPACITRMMGNYAGKEKNGLQTFLSICQKSGYQVLIDQQINGNCCSQIFSSKGLKSAQAFTANRIVSRLWESSQRGRFPIVIDVSSCAYTLHQIRPALHLENQERFDRLTILDSIDFLHDRVMPNAGSIIRQKDVVLHPVCSLQKMKIEHKFLAVAQRYARSVTVPTQAGCCGMAGDRGFLFPELTASATRAEAQEVSQRPFDGYYSSTKTCEMAMSEALQVNYESILYLVDESMS